MLNLFRFTGHDGSNRPSIWPVPFVNSKPLQARNMNRRKNTVDTLN